MPQNKKTSIGLTLLQVILPGIATIIVAYIGYLGIKYQSDIPAQPTKNVINEAVIKFVVLDKTSGENISGATIALQIDVMPSEINVTDTNGVARFFLKPESIGLHGFLQIEADGYKSQKRDIDIDEKKPLVIYLESKDSTLVTPTTPTFTSTTFLCPQAPKTRLAVGDRAKITSGELSRLRTKPESGGNVIVMIAPMTEIEIVEGPICYPRPSRNDAYVYWKVRVTSKSLEGWLAEGDFEHYYIEPVP
jgi:hypothetical protein